MSCDSLNRTALQLNVSVASLPEGFCPASMQELAAAISDRLTISPNTDFNTFAIGSVAPTSNVGPWFKDCERWFVYDDATASYIPIYKGGFDQMEYFVTSGNFVVPEGIYRIQIEGFGGGGGGCELSAPSSGSGGGGGAYGLSIIAVTPFQVISYVVGAGGAGGATGSNGGATTFLAMTAGGGIGATSFTLAGAGGAATGFDINLTGQHGSSATVGGAANGGAPGGDAAGWGGKGGVVGSRDSAVGRNGLAPGGGGSGAAGNSVVTGNGAAGAIKIMY